MLEADNAMKRIKRLLLLRPMTSASCHKRLVKNKKKLGELIPNIS